MLSAYMIIYASTHNAGFSSKAFLFKTVHEFCHGDDGYGLKIPSITVSQ